MLGLLLSLRQLLCTFGIGGKECSLRASVRAILRTYLLLCNYSLRELVGARGENVYAGEGKYGGLSRCSDMLYELFVSHSVCTALIALLIASPIIAVSKFVCSSMARMASLCAIEITV